MKNINILEQIDLHYKDMSKCNKKISDYVKNNLYKIPFLKISELSKKVGVSNASVTRFTKTLGFDGYIDFQEAATIIVKQDVSPMKQLKKSIESDSYKGKTLVRSIASNIKSMESLLTEALLENYDKSIDILESSETIYIVASRSSYSVGYYLYFMLKGLMENVILIKSGSEDYSNILSHVTSRDSLIVVSYARYTKFTCKILEYFSRLDCKIIALTDSYSSPIAQGADQVLLAKNPIEGHSFVNAMVIASSIVTSIGRADREESLKKLDKQIQIAMDIGIYL